MGTVVVPRAMSIVKLFLLACATASAFKAAPPNMPASWAAETMQKLILWQGGIYNATSETACCEVGASQCKVQAQGLSGNMFVDGQGNRTAFSVGPEAEISLYNEKSQGMDIIATPAADGKGWNCTSYCPIGRSFFNPVGIPSKAKDEGSKKVPASGKTLEEFTWFDELVVIKMDENDAYVDLSDASNPVPVTFVEKITPFGGAEIATMSNVYDNFKAGEPSADNFNVVNVDSCPESDQCNQNSAQYSRTRSARLAAANKQTLLKKAQQYVADHPKEVMAAVKENSMTQSPATDSYKWPVDFVSHMSNVMIINQGGTVTPDGSAVCCTATYAGQCQVQLESTIGQLYHDYSHNRSRFENSAAGVTFVDDFNTHSSMQVVRNGSVDVCKSYCPIDPEETLDGGRDYFIDDNATDKGNSTYKGRPAHQWEWKDVILKVITMQTTDFYADTSGNTVLPLAAVTSLTPFGQHLGDQNQVWSNFQAVTPPASKFDIQGVADCPQDPQCGQQVWQAHRLSQRQLHTFAKYFDVMHQK